MKDTGERVRSGEVGVTSGSLSGEDVSLSRRVDSDFRSLENHESRKGPLQQ